MGFVGISFFLMGAFGDDAVTNSRLYGNRTSGGLLDAVGRDRAVSAQVMIWRAVQGRMPPNAKAANNDKATANMRSEPSSNGAGKTV
jgi:hypothetical protein